MADDLNPTTEAELQARLDRLLLNAKSNGIAVDDTSFTLRHDEPELHDWEIIISRLAKGITV